MKPGATQEEITKAYRKKSRLLHPDKAKQSFIASYTASKAQDKTGKQSQQKKKPGVRVSKGPSDAEVRKAVKAANERFARLGVVTNILRGSGRERYDHFLKNGFPKWRGTGYYYARYRPGLGSVLLGLFVFGGGAAHYVALYLGWKRQREFVGRYIRHARRAAWGDDTGIKGLPPMDGSSASGAVPTQSNEMDMQSMNRRQRRMQERENKKSKGRREPSGTPVEGTAATSGPTGDRKRVVAENGKVLIVDSVGNVYLEEENEDGQTEEYLLDVFVTRRISAKAVPNPRCRSMRSRSPPFDRRCSSDYPPGLLLKSRSGSDDRLGPRPAPVKYHPGARPRATATRSTSIRKCRRRPMEGQMREPRGQAKGERPRSHERADGYEIASSAAQIDHCLGYFAILTVRHAFSTRFDF